MRNYLYATRYLTAQQTTLEQRIRFLAALTVNGVVAVHEPIEKCIALALENSWQGAERHISGELGSSSITRNRI